tara:strand:+ start:421 stop:1239 length:819 start_codon:yes stop_codon:yes gene_type:complete
MNEIVLQDGGLSLAEMSAELGASSTSTGPSIPNLGMNYDGENGAMGAFYLKTGQDQVYATEGVRFRAFSNHIQYQHWGDDNSLVNKSLLIKNAKEEARDQLGGLNCSMPSYEDSIQMSPEQKEKYKGIDKYRIVRGLVSYTGKTSDGREITIENHPCVLSVKRKNYGPFYHDVVKKLPQGMNLWDFESILSKDNLTNSYGKKFYVMHFAPQYGSPIEMDQITYDSLSHVRGLITSENKKIEEAYKDAMIRGKDAAQADRIDTVIQALDADVA